MVKVKKPTILFPRGVTTRLAKHYGVTQYTVRKALNFESNSDLAKTIREDCINNYGGKLSEVIISQ